MRAVKYFFQFLIIMFLFLIFKIIGYKNASNLGSFIGSKIGPLFRSKKIILMNLEKSFPELSNEDILEIIKKMWKNYGRILSDYVFIKDFRNEKLKRFLTTNGKEFLQDIKKGEPVIFISGHFNNFELMAMEIEKNGIDLAAIYRPLNNHFLNGIMENIRKKYICRNQIKKGNSGTRKAVKYFKKGYSIAIMIDQRVSEGIISKFYNRDALTTTIPAQFIKKYGCKIMPVYINRKEKFYFDINFSKPISFNKGEKIEDITHKLNLWLETQISNDPSQWIWTHNRWK